MSTLTMDPELFQTLATCTSILVAKMLLTNFYAAVPKAFAGQNPPEDTWVWKPLTGVPEQTHGVGGSSKDENKGSHQAAATARANRIIGNDVENIPISLIALWVAAAASERSADIALLAKIFCVSRVLHSALYLGGITGVRTLAFATGYLAIFRVIYLILEGVGNL